MAENTQTPNPTVPVETEAERQAKIQAFIATKGAERIVPADAKGFEPLVKRNVEPKDFTALPAHMKRFKVWAIVMTYREAADYIGFAHELYTEEPDEVTGKSVVPFSQQWQRKLDSKRVQDAKTYLKSENHFFPALVCVPTSAESCLFVDGKVRISKAGISALDGQHRTGGIHEGVKDFAEILDECITVQIIDVMDIETRRQIFADINRTPRKVPKALNLAYDSADRVARIAKQIISYTVTTDEHGAENPNGTFKNQPLKKLFDDYPRPNPLAKSSNLMTLTNLYNLIKPMSEVDTDKGYALSEDLIRQVVQSILFSLPDTDRLYRGTTTFDSIKKEFVFSTGTIWQALGQLLAERLKAKNEAGEAKYPADQFPSVVEGWITKIANAGNWKLTAKIWADPARRVVTDGKKVGSQKGDIKNAVDVLRDQTN